MEQYSISAFAISIDKWYNEIEKGTYLNNNKCQ